LTPVRETIVAVEKQLLSHILSVLVVLGIQLAMRNGHIVICGLTRSIIYFHVISYAAKFKKKKRFIEHEMFVSIFSTIFV
jgi:uncharacterized membrane protein